MASIGAIMGTGSAQDTTETTSKSTTGQAASQETFLKLLVAQIQNQNPLNPADGVEFLSQLAQFSQLEQSIGIHEEVTGLRNDFNNALATPAAEEPAAA
jgi:flagellar basal-body rod modification protein FlgD